jgi:hypothetical protein
MMDIQQIEREFRRILNSHKSILQKQAMADRLCQKVNEFYASLTDDQARSQFRANYRTFAETGFGSSPSSVPTAQAPLIERIIDHARNLKEAEAKREELNRELGDF